MDVKTPSWIYLFQVLYMDNHTVYHQLELDFKD